MEITARHLINIAQALNWQVNVFKPEHLCLCVQIIIPKQPNQSLKDSFRSQNPLAWQLFHSDTLSTTTKIAFWKKNCQMACKVCIITKQRQISSGRFSNKSFDIAVKVERKRRMHYWSLLKMTLNFVSDILFVLNVLYCSRSADHNSI